MYSGEDVRKRDGAGVDATFRGSVAVFVEWNTVSVESETLIREII